MNRIGNHLKNNTKPSALLFLITAAGSDSDVFENDITIDHGRIIIEGSNLQEESSVEGSSSESSKDSSKDSSDESSDESGDESSDESSVDEMSNLQRLASAMGYDKISSLMRDLHYKCGFLIGPSTHSYYKSQKVYSKQYEHERLELIHPDLHPDYKHPEGATSMRKF